MREISGFERSAFAGLKSRFCGAEKPVLRPSKADFAALNTGHCQCKNFLKEIEAGCAGGQQMAFFANEKSVLYLRASLCSPLNEEQGLL